MQKATRMGVLFAALRGAVCGLVMVAALDKALTAWHDGALGHGLAALAVGVLFAVVLYRMYLVQGVAAADTEAAEPA